MKRWKKILCLVLVLAVALAVVACGSFEPRMIVGLQKMSKLESLHSDTTLCKSRTCRLPRSIR